MAARIKNLGFVPDKDTVAMMDTPSSHVRTFEEIVQERGSYLSIVYWTTRVLKPLMFTLLVCA
jgi:hypothetical protein